MGGSFISSPEPKACKLLTFSSSSPEPLGQFQPKTWHKASFGWLRGFKFVQIKGPALFQGEIITKRQKNIYKIYKSSSPEPQGQFQSNLAQCIPGVKRTQVGSNEGPHSFPRGDNYEIVKMQ